MTTLDLIRLLCRIYDALDRHLMPGAAQLAGATWVAVRNLPQMLGFYPPPGERPVVLFATLRLWSPRWFWRLILPLQDLVTSGLLLLAKIRRRFPGCFRFLKWLRDFLIDALVILAGTAAICAMIWWFMYA